MALESTHKKGRPNIKVRVGMQEKIMEYYEKNVSAVTASRETGYNVKTVYKYYGEFSKQVLESQTIDIIERKNIETAQLILSHERLILKMQQLLDNALEEMSRLIQENKPMPKHLIGDLARLINYIAEMNEKKYELSSNLTSTNAIVPEKDESDDVVKKIVRYLVMDRTHEHGAYTEREIIQAIIDFTKCDVPYAKSIFLKMMNLGLGVCNRDDMDSKYGEKYWILPFATTREYISNEEFYKVMDDARKEREYETKIEEREKEFIAKYGEKSTWTKEIREEFYSEDDDLA